MIATERTNATMAEWRYLQRRTDTRLAQPQTTTKRHSVVSRTSWTPVTLGKETCDAVPAATDSVASPWVVGSLYYFRSDTDSCPVPCCRDSWTAWRRKDSRDSPDFRDVHFHSQHLQVLTHSTQQWLQNKFIEALGQKDRNFRCPRQWDRQTDGRQTVTLYAFR